MKAAMTLTTQDLTAIKTLLDDHTETKIRPMVHEIVNTAVSTAIDDLLDVLTELGKWGGLLVIAAFAAFIATKWWQRKRFFKSR